VSRRRFEHTIVLGIAIELSMVIGFTAFIGAPRWRLQAFTPTVDLGVSFVPSDWSPDGGALLTATPGRFKILGWDGSVFQGPDPGWSPVWIDARHIAILERKFGSSVVHLVRMEIAGGDRRTLSGPLAPGRLVGDGRGHLAYQSDDGPLTTTVLDPQDGHTVADLDGYRMSSWTVDGALLLTRPEPRVERYYPNGGPMFLWRPGEQPRALGAELANAGTVAPMSPTGDELACICVVKPFPEPTPNGPERAIYRVPIDGSPPVYLVPWPRHGGASPEIAWIDATTLAVIADDGLTHISTAGGSKVVSGLSASDLGFRTAFGRVFELRGSTVAVLQDLVGGVESTLVVVDREDRIRMRTRFFGWLPDVSVDHVHDRGVVSSEQIRDGEPSLLDLTVVEFR
jgi:RNase P/RNase MRP subunit p29